MLASVHLVRHGEVLNPDGIVYGDLPGFFLSDAGRAQTVTAAARLSGVPVDALVVSPLERARATAEPIAAVVETKLLIDDRLTEWAIGTRWAGVAWHDLPIRFPGEVEAYEEHPDDLPFLSETLADLANRMHDVIVELGELHPGGTAVLVSHQDPVQVLRLRLIGRDLSNLHADKPSHGSVISLRANGSTWVEESSWSPPIDSAAFPPVERWAADS
ncbi:MAG: histidine phosphatase family protein [Acidimicrobiia bacterium]